MTDLSGLLEFAVELATRAGDRALATYGARLEDRFPEDGILGEEFGETRCGASRRWILDPIDGTRTFVHGVPLFGVLIALETDGAASLGVMHFPALSETVAAAVGAGCFWNGSRCSVSEVDELSDALVLITDVEHAEQEGRGAAWRRLAGRAGLARTWGDCYGHALVATGRAEVMVDPVLSLWDSAALAPILTEAGGRFTDWDGRASHRVAGGISTNEALAAPARRCLGVGGDDGPAVEGGDAVAQ